MSGTASAMTGVLCAIHPWSLTITQRSTKANPKKRIRPMKLIENTSPPRGKGVTILINGHVLTTQLPVLEDQKFLHQASHWFREYQKDKPLG